MSCKVQRAVNGFFRSIVTSALNPVFKLLGQTLLSSPRVDQLDRARTLWTTSAWIANTCFVLLVVAGGLLLMGHGTVQSSYTAKDIAPRMVVGMVAANTSLLFIGQAIDVANALSQALMGQGVDPDKAAGTLQSLVVRAIANANDPFMPLLAAVAVVLGLAVVVIYLVRIMLLVLLTAAAPLALACHALPQTDGLARLWWRSLAGVLAVQVAQSLVLITALQVFFSSNQAAVFGIGTPGGMLDLLLVICLLYILMRIPSWVSRLIWQGGLRSSPIVRTAKTVAAIAVFRGTLGKAAATRASASRPNASMPRPRGAGRQLPQPPRSPAPAGPQPRWGHPGRQWTPPDPVWHERVHRRRSAPDSTARQQRWGRPDTTWTPPRAGDRRSTPPAPPRRPPAPPLPRPDPDRPWTRPN